MKCERCGEVNPAEIHTCSPQEPVAWMSQGGDVSRSRRYFEEMGFVDLIPLYTAPPQREWVGLTDREIDELFLDHMEELFHGRDYDYERAIEAKLKEKNHG